MSRQLVLCGLFLFIETVFVYNISTQPDFINGDEAGSLIQPLEIRHSDIKGSLFNLTHDGSVSYLVYLPKTLLNLPFKSVNQLLVSRLWTVVMSLGTLWFFYLILKEKLSFAPAVLSTLLLASNQVFLSFSRVSWINMDSAFAVTLLIYLCQKKLASPSWLITLTGSLVLYEYMGGRPEILLLPLTMLINLRHSQNHTQLQKYIFILLGIGALFAIQININLKNFAQYSRRATSVSIFKYAQYFHRAPVYVFLNQSNLLVKGLLENDPYTNHGSVENSRLIPPGTGPFNPLVHVLFVIGLTVGLSQAKKYWLWLTALGINIFIVQYFSTMIPSWGRILPVLPMVVGISAITVHELWRISNLAAKTFIAVVIVYFSILNYWQYFTWIASPTYFKFHQPGIHLPEYPAWLHEQEYRIEHHLFQISFTDWSDPKKHLTGF